MAAGNILLQANDSKVADIRFEDGAAGNVSVVFPKEGGTLANETFVNTAISAIPAVKMPPPVRQTVLSGTVDTSGFSAFGGLDGSTTVSTSTTLEATCADGTNDRIGTIINPSWTGLSTNGTMYLYLDIATDGTCTTGSTTLAPTYRWGGADVVTNLQNTFNIQEMKMKVGNGSTASQVYRVFVGEVKVMQDVVTTIIWYALMGRYSSAYVATFPATATLINLSHNIGTTIDIPKLAIECTTTDIGYSVGDVVFLNTQVSGPGTYASPSTFINRLQCGFNTGTAPLYFAHKTTGALAGITNAKWKYRMIAQRGW